MPIHVEIPHNHKCKLCMVNYTCFAPKCGDIRLCQDCGIITLDRSEYRIENIKPVTALMVREKDV